MASISLIVSDLRRGLQQGPLGTVPVPIGLSGEVRISWLPEIQGDLDVHGPNRLSGITHSYDQRHYPETADSQGDGSA